MLKETFIFFLCLASFIIGFVIGEQRERNKNIDSIEFRGLCVEHDGNKVIGLS